MGLLNIVRKEKEEIMEISCMVSASDNYGKTMALYINYQNLTGVTQIT